jgi:glycosyltransferase involved in cell wall biosynthesis
MKVPAIWITWERQRRNRELSWAVGAVLYEWADLDARRRGPGKYLIGAWRTLRTIRDVSPAVVFCQNPSLVLAALLLAIRPLFRLSVVVDAHNAGLTPLEGRSRLLGSVARWIQRRADLTIVTNPGLKRLVEANGGSALVLPDRIPELPRRTVKERIKRSSVLFVCSFAADEPYDAVLEAAAILAPDVAVYISGNPKKAGVHQRRLPANVHLTGYLPDDEYVALLSSVGVVMDLTEREDCLVCGAYEAVAAGQPLILSDTKANREYFDAGCVYTRHSPAAIAAAVVSALSQIAILSAGIQALRSRRVAEWELLRAELLAAVRSAVARPPGCDKRPGE